MRRHELSEAQWNKIKDLLPPERKPQGGRPAKSNREMLNAIVYWLNTGIPWRDLPERFGPWQSVYSRFRAWTKAGVWENVLVQLIQQDIVDETTLMLDSTSIKVHQHASSCKNLSGKLVLADKGYDSDKLSDWIKGRGGITVIPSRRSARHPRKIDWDVYKERHLIENLFLKLKNHRRFSTRYEKKAVYFHAVVSLACILVWLL